MPDLAGRGPLGLKKSKTELTARVYYGEILDPVEEKKKPAPKRRKPAPYVSAKRAAYMASPERKAGKAHMAKVAMLPCLVCGAWPVEVHHATKPRNDMQVLPLCPRHHRREFGVGAYHYSPKAFVALHGPISGLLERVAGMLTRALP